MADKVKKITSLKGMHDNLPPESFKWQYVERVAHDIATTFGFKEIRTPVLEKTELFKRSVGETTDIVQKEMYTFDMGRESITIKPEGTAGVARAVMQNGVLNDILPAKFYYLTSVFRHENPQAGRLREHHQFGVECFGSESPAQDAEVISLAEQFLKRVGITKLSVHLNSIGCPNCKPEYDKKLKEYYTQHLEHLCDDCKNRIDRNPLRLLDCKVESCQPYKKGAPRIADNLCEDCHTHFEGVKSALEAIEINYVLDPDIVRGLDYYNRTVFEFVSEDIGSQGTVCGGGRYDGLLTQMGGTPAPALGFGLGIERLIMVMDSIGVPFPEPPNCDLYIGSIGNKANIKALKLTTKLREEGFTVLFDTMGRGIRPQMKYADKINATFSCVLGDNELENNKTSVKNMTSGESTEIGLTTEDFTKLLYLGVMDNIIDAGEGIKF